MEVTGTVYLNGKPLKDAQVYTRPVGLPPSRGAMGVTDAEGRFMLRTDVDGDLLPGAYLGEHRVAVGAPDPNVPRGPFKPPLITPPEYADFETTPLRIQVDRNPARNQIEFRMERKAACRRSSGGSRLRDPQAEMPVPPCQNRPCSGNVQILALLVLGVAVGWALAKLRKSCY